MTGAKRKVVRKAGGKGLGTGDASKAAQDPTPAPEAVSDAEAEPSAPKLDERGLVPLEPPAKPGEKPFKQPRGRPRKISTEVDRPETSPLRAAVRKSDRRKRGKSTAHFEDGEEPWRCRGKSGARSREAGHPVRCPNNKRPGYEVCGSHGAKGGRPIKHGMYSTAGTRLGDIFDRFIQDADQSKDLDVTLVMATSLLQTRLDKMRELDTPDFRKRAVNLLERSREAAAGGEHQASAKLMGELYALLKRGVAEDRAVDRVEAALDRVEKYQTDFAKLQLMGDKVITEKEFLAYFVRWSETLAQVASPEVVFEVTRRIDLPR